MCMGAHGVSLCVKSVTDVRVLLCHSPFYWLSQCLSHWTQILVSLAGKLTLGFPISAFWKLAFCWATRPMWLLRIQTQVLRFVQPRLYPLNHPLPLHQCKLLYSQCEGLIVLVLKMLSIVERNTVCLLVIVTTEQLQTVCLNQSQWHIPMTLSLIKLSWENKEFKASPSYIKMPCFLTAAMALVPTWLMTPITTVLGNLTPFSGLCELYTVHEYTCTKTLILIN